MRSLVLYALCCLIWLSVCCDAQTAGSGSALVAGNVKTYQICTANGTSCRPVSDSGTVSLTVGGYTSTASYDAGVTLLQVEQSLLTGLNASGSPVTATLSSNLLSFTSKTTGQVSNLPLSWSGTVNEGGCSKGCHSTPDFTLQLSGSALTGGNSGVSISGLSPTSGAVGTVVVITGTGFGASQGSSTVSLNGVPATPTSWTDTSITVPVPGGASSGSFTVTVAGAQAVSSTFTVLQSPFITAISPTSGPVGTVVTITGVGFTAAPGPATVDFNGTIPTSYVSWSSTSIQVAVPEGATTGSVYVTASNVSSNGVSFVVTKQTPTITWAQPASIQPGTALSSTQLNATASTAGTFIYSPAAGTVLPAGANTLTVTFTPSDTADYNIARASVTLQVTSCTGGATISTIAGTGMAGFSGDSGAAINAMLNGPASITQDSSGNIYIADALNYRVRKLNISTGSIVTIAGDGVNHIDGDGLPATSAGLAIPASVAVDAGGDVFIGSAGSDDSGTEDDSVRMVSTASGTISTIDLELATSLSLDTSGDLYIGSIRDIDRLNLATRTETCIVGSDAVGVPPSACTYHPPPGYDSPTYGIAYSAQSNTLYFSTGANIFSINAQGILSTVAGTGTLGYSRDNGPATQAAINATSYALAVDAQGNVYFSDNRTRIREIIAASGTVITVAGTGVAGFSGDGGSAVCAEVNNPLGITINSGGGIIFSDANNNRVREVGVTKLTPSLTLTATPTSVPFGALASFTAALGNVSNPTGNITFEIDGATFGTVALSGTGATYNGPNEAWSVGIHTITAVYSGDNYNNSVSTSISFTVTAAPPPQIYGILADPATVGTQVTISGDGYGWDKGSSTVSFNGVAATPISWTPTDIVVAVPVGATTGNVIVTVGGIPSNAYLFMVSGNCPP